MSAGDLAGRTRRELKTLSFPTTNGPPSVLYGLFNRYYLSAAAAVFLAGPSTRVQVFKHRTSEKVLFKQPAKASSQ